MSRLSLKSALVIIGVAALAGRAASVDGGLGGDDQFQAQLNSLQENVQAAPTLSSPSKIQRLQGFFHRQPSSQDGQDKGLEQQIVKMDSSLRNNPDVVTDRRLESYESLLADSFRADLFGLGPGQQWVDVGAGGALAEVDYLNAGGKAKITAVTLTETKSAELDEALSAYGPARFRYLTGKHVEEYGAADLGKADLITDVYGAVAYSPHIDAVIAKMADILKVGGKIYTLLADGDGAPAVGIRGPRGEKIKDEEWFQSIKGFKMQAQIRDFGSRKAIVLEKISDAVDVPPLTLVKYDEGYPPHRAYLWAQSLSEGRR